MDMRTDEKVKSLLLRQYEQAQDAYERAIKAHYNVRDWPMARAREHHNDIDCQRALNAVRETRRRYYDAQAGALVQPAYHQMQQEVE